MGYVYAELDENKRVKGVSDLKAAVTKGNMIKLDSYDMDKLGRVYDPLKKTFSEKEAPEIVQKSIEETMLELLQKIAAKLGA